MDGFDFTTAVKKRAKVQVTEKIPPSARKPLLC
jgi:hypothetical protein